MATVACFPHGDLSGNGIPGNQVDFRVFFQHVL